MKDDNVQAPTGRVALVTGGARGFGRAFGEALAARGAHVVLVDLDGDEAQAAAAAIRDAGGSASSSAGDVVDEARMAEVMAETAELHGGLDVLINNAGLHSRDYSQPITTMGLAKTRRLFEVNVMGTICCTLAALPFMRGRPGANVLNVGSSAAHLGGTAYGDSKLAVAGLTITFARELGAEGIRVNAISPGMILTDTIRAELPAAAMERVRAMQMLKVDGAESDVVEAMLFLTSPAARFVTGEVLRVTGGMAAGV